MNDLKEIQINNNATLASFDITNMYSNVPTNQLKEIFINTLKLTYTDETPYKT